MADASAFNLLKIDNPDSVESVQTGSPTVGSYSIDVNSLAASQVLASNGFASSSTVVGTGTLTLRSGPLLIPLAVPVPTVALRQIILRQLL